MKNGFLTILDHIHGQVVRQYQQKKLSAVFPVDTFARTLPCAAMFGQPAHHFIAGPLTA